MTTVGVKADPLDGTLPLRIPSYSYQYPTFRSVQLAAVKEGLYHPRLPTFRRMDMDTAAHKLSEEHCRTTTTCGPVDFRRATTTHFMPPENKLSTLNVTQTGRDIHRYYTTPEELKTTRKDWSDFLNKSPERYNINLPDLPSNKDLAFQGYAVRYLKPEVTGSWKCAVPGYVSAVQPQHRDRSLALGYTHLYGSRIGCEVCENFKYPQNMDSRQIRDNYYKTIYKKHICDHEKEVF
ncbi:sperm microtubule inner protein 8-like isoform X1 [Lineus longissimus]|uniref:sperm microtubule inner protein 8-like isoform X1 n=1 Tax=Lineus longissimus TaxID=88925 RepID=UPI002B4E15B1